MKDAIPASFPSPEFLHPDMLNSSQSVRCGRSLAQFIGIVWALMSLISVFTFSQRNWKGGLLWLLVGVG